MCLFYLISFLLFHPNYCAIKKYTNYTLYRGVPVNKSHLNFFNSLSEMFDVNFWTPPGSLYKPIDFVLAPGDKKAFLKMAEEYDVYLSTLIADVQRAFDMQRVKSYIRRNLGSFDWNDFYRINDIYNWLKDLKDKYPEFVKVESIGTTYEKRPILAVHVTLPGSKLRSKVIVEGGIHAREWIGPCFVTYMLQQILDSPKSNNSNLKDIALTYEWFFVPVLNPDGYEYTHTNNRLWRKNRNNEYGVDLNRNFDHAFGTVGVSFSHYEDTYCGAKAFSEKETIAMSHFVRNHSKHLEYYLAFHSYGQAMILPYANTRAHMENFDTVAAMAKQAADHIALRYNTRYVYGTAYDTVGYVTSGVSGCWVKETFSVPYVLTFELPDRGQYGFALPNEKITPTCIETMDGVLSLLKPRTKIYDKLRHEHRGLDDGQRTKFLDKLVILFNVCLFVIVRFD
ncbi:zinc carboxypeptidase-like [Bombyx mandarina]|uniref:Zinc carboxypeptidase-like n=1 Tax=Bombyx mandarina TaxID=7092 RepID=A0A6J2JNS1_BOMMA|nr:zinc carboxypeptidase-like [Bombyx mandarina]